MTDREQARTTVVIPVWDGYVALRFAEAVASITNQDVPVKVLVIDNASHVALPALANVEVVRISERVSLGRARNVGLERVDTEMVMFADADDLILPGVIGRLQSGIDSDPRLVAFAMAFIDAETGERHRWPRRWISQLVRFPTLLALVNAVWAVYPITGPVLLRADVACSVGGHADIDNGDARCLGAALLFRGRVGWFEAPGCVYHRRSGSNLDRFSGAAAILESLSAVRERLRTDFGGPGWLPRMVPLIAIAQRAAVTAHLLLSATRAMVRRRRSV